MATKFLEGHELADEIRNMLESGDELTFAVAYWGEGAPESLGLIDAKTKKKTAQNIRVFCNLMSGACNPKVISEMIEAEIKVFRHDELHAKIYLSHNAVIVGSSNASASGLSLEGSELVAWLEGNIWTDDPDVISKIQLWIKNLGDLSVSKSDVETATSLWELRRSMRPMPKPLSSTPLDIVELFFKSEKARKSLSDRKIEIWVYLEEDFSELSEIAGAKEKKLLNVSDLDWYEEKHTADAMGHDDKVIIDLGYTKPYGIRKYEPYVWKMERDCAREVPKSGGRWNLYCRPSKEFTVGKTKIDKFTKIIDDKCAGRKEVIISLDDLIKDYRPSER